MSTTLQSTKKRGPARGQAGFTLIELMVSVALFSVVMVIALGALISMSVAVRKAEAINSTVNNLSSAIDSMSRSIRTGYNFHCTTAGLPTTPLDCAGTPDSYFTYQAFDASQVTYCLSDGNATPACNSGISCPAGKSCTILRKISSGPYTNMTSAEVNIKSFALYVEGAPLGDAKQPKVTMVVAGQVQVTSGQTSNFNIQTSATQRIYDQ